MDAHSWLDVFGYVLTAAITLIAVFLAYLLNRHAKERENVQEALREHDKQLAAHQTIIDLVTQTFRFK